MADEQKSRAEFFENVYRRNLWEGLESRSGQGSDVAYTQDLIKALPGMLRRLEIKSFLDVPCGDFNWMKYVDFGSTSYLGGDIVGELVAKNRKLYESASRRFEVIDMVTDRLPMFDMIFIRDCFIHFSNALVLETLANVRRSGIRYVCLTNDLNPLRFPHGANIELDRTVSDVNFEFRPICFELPPYSFPPPIKVMLDGQAWHPWNGIKAMCVWETAAIERTIGAH